MKIFTDNELKLSALDYAERNKIVNQKTIKAYQDAVRSAEKHFTTDFMIKWISENWNRTDNQIEDKASEVYYGGSGESINKAYQNEKIRLYKERELAVACKKYLEKDL